MSPSPTGDDITITLGVEEELFLIDPDSRDLLSDPDPRIFEACTAASGGQQVVREFLRSQIETNTAVHDSVAGVCEGLKAARRIVVEAAHAHGAALIGASAHPFGRPGKRNCRRRRTATGSSPRPTRRRFAAWSSAACTCTPVSATSIPGSG